MKRYWKVALSLITIMSLCFGQIPQLINYQGNLSDSEGNSLNGSYTIDFRIYNQSEGGDLLWSETQMAAVSIGKFSVMLGSVNTLSNDIFDGNPIYLALKIGEDSEMIPRKIITSVGYAYKALDTDKLGGIYAENYIQADQENSISTVMITDNAVTIEKISPNIISSIDGVSNDAGDIDLIAGNNITITPDVAAKSITISAAGGEAADNLGNHIARQNLQMNGKWISNNGSNEGIYVSDAGNVGINTTEFKDVLYDTKFRSISTNYDAAIAGFSTNEAEPGVGGFFRSVGQGGLGVLSISEDNEGIGVLGTVTGDDGVAVVGRSHGNNSTGVYGLATWVENGIGVHGKADYWQDTNENSYGGYFESFGHNGRGILGRATGDYGYGVYGLSLSTISGAAVRGDGAFVGVWGESSGRWGVYGKSTGTSSSFGVYGTVANGTGNYAGYFAGDVNVTGTLSKSAGSFRIDHPKDPENKYLQHSFVESPDMMNVYNGNIILDETGEAIVELPDYFDALNNDFRYQLTCIGGFAPVYIAEKINNNQFKIAGGELGMEISWQVTGIRKDVYAKQNPVLPEIQKEDNEKGKYLHPKLYNMPESMGIGYEDNQKMLKNYEDNTKINRE